MADENKKGITVKIDADLHAQVKCKLEEPLNLAYFRRIYRNQGQTNPFHIGSIRR